MSQASHNNTGASLKSSSIRTQSPHPMLSFYQVPASTYNHLPYGSGLSIPTSNSRPTSPRRDVDLEMGESHTMQSSYMIPNHHQNGSGSGYSGVREHDRWASMIPSASTSASPASIKYEDNILPASKKRRLSNTSHEQYYGQQQTQHGSSAKADLAAGSFLMGLRGAEDLGSPDLEDDESQDDMSGDDARTEYGEPARGAKGKGRDDGRNKKTKLTRGSRACTVCRRLKMKCIEADVDNGVRCLRCRNSNLECVFEESMRGKRSTKSKKNETMARNLKNVENTLDTVLRSIHNPSLSLASGMTNISPSGQVRGLEASPRGNATDILTPDKPGDRLELRDASTRPGISPLATHQDPISPSNMSAVNNLPSSPRLHSLPDSTLNPLGLLAEASLQNRKRSNTNIGSSRPGSTVQPSSAENMAHGSEGLHSNSTGKKGKGKGKEEVSGEETKPKRLGVGDASYFRPGPMSSLGLRRVFIERELKPEILAFTSALQVNELFDIYFNNLHRHVPVLNRELHTPASVCARSPFLLTAICAIASRFYPQHPELRPKLAAVAKKLMFDRPSRGYKSLEIVQAYLLLSNWTLGPEERWEQDLTYLLLGLAIRIATDMNLYKKNNVMPLDTEEGRLRDKEIANRERTWLLCYMLDRSMSAQMGKPYSIREDTIVRESAFPSWYARPSSQPEDIVLAAYADLQRIMSRALDVLHSQQATGSGLVAGIDYPLVVTGILDQLEVWLRVWQPPTSDIALAPGLKSVTLMYRSIAYFYHQYNSLVLSSFALQYAIESSVVDLPVWFNRVYSAALGVLRVVKEDLAPTQSITYFTDGQMVMICYAVLSLLKLIRPEFKSLHRDPQTAIDSLNETVDILADTAVDEVHSVGLYSNLLRNLVANKAEEYRSWWNASEKDGNNARRSRNGVSTNGPGGLDAGARAQEDEGLMWNPFTGMSLSNLSQAMGSGSGLSMPNTNPVLVPNTNDVAENGESIGPNMVAAMNGTIWPHAAISSAPTPIAEQTDPALSNLNGLVDGAVVYNDPLNNVPYGFEDVNWENSLLMPGFGGFGQLELSGGFVHTHFGSGILSPNVGMTPAHSRPQSPRHIPSNLRQF